MNPKLYFRQYFITRKIDLFVDEGSGSVFYRIRIQVILKDWIRIQIRNTAFMVRLGLTIAYKDKCRNKGS